jgi:hypothetical protein
MDFVRRIRRLDRGWQGIHQPARPSSPAIPGLGLTNADLVTHAGDGTGRLFPEQGHQGAAAALPALFLRILA